jgi:hypothetical protein
VDLLDPVYFVSLVPLVAQLSLLLQLQQHYQKQFDIVLDLSASIALNFGLVQTVLALLF